MRNETKNIAYSYFIIHALVEFVCFYMLYGRFSLGALAWMVAFVYDAIAFVPQGLIGSLFEKKHFDLGTAGVLLMVIGILIYSFSFYGSLILIALGNAFIHEAGAIATTVVSEGKCSASAIFVAGGSFGLIFGQVAGNAHYSLIGLCLLCCLVMEVMILKTNPFWLKEEITYPEFDYVNRDISFGAILYVALFVVTARSFIGYSIPISWKKEIWQSFMLFFVMGAGKALGGILADKYGARKIGVLSTLLCIPFLLFGKEVMVVSVFGVFLFSLTMSITFSMCLSIVTEPGLAFGVTTVGLFLGLLPQFIFGAISVTINMILIVVLSCVSAYGLYRTLK